MPVDWDKKMALGYYSYSAGKGGRPEKNVDDPEY